MGRKRKYKNKAEKQKALRRRKKAGGNLRRVFVIPPERYLEGRDIEEVDFETNTLDGVKSFIKSSYKGLSYTSFGNEGEKQAVLEFLKETEGIEVLFI